ncbi:MAG: T9SS type A sorting domain-containing protein [Bacteroidetes bacterium]|nr:T9SS type A sorting domain-containing protein [Bacteroidota bacterium]
MRGTDNLIKGPNRGQIAIIEAILVTIGLLGNPLFAQQVYSSSGSFASYATDSTGNLYVWGEDEYLHPIATTMTAQDLTPVRVAFPNGVTKWISAAAGHFHSLALGNDGNVYSWGYNASGQLGNGDTLNSDTPVKVELPAGVSATAIACGYDHSLAIGNDGNVYAWGDNSDGQLGNGFTTNSDIPVKVNLPGGFVPAQICASWNYSFAVGADGSLYAWGTDGQGQLGLGNTTNQLLPVKVPLPQGVTKWIAVYGGIYFAVAIGNDGNLYACGYNTYGQLGNGTTNNSATFVKVNMPSDVTGWNEVACVGSSVLAIANNDTLYSWGYGGEGEMGNGTGGTAAVVNSAPVKVALPAGVRARAIAGERFDGLAVGSDDYYYAWGQGSEGELGNGTNTGSYVPVKVYGLVQVAPGIPVPMSPANGALNQPTSLTLKWSQAPDAVGYQCQLSTDSSFTSDIIVNDSTLTDTTKNVIGLGGSTKYYWRVRSYNNGVFSEYSSVDTFATLNQPPAVPTIISPVNNAMNQPAIDTLRCSTASGALKYHWEVSTTLSFTSLIINDSTTDTIRIVTLTGGEKYYWQVSAVNPTGPSAFAGPDSFTVMAVPAEAPVLLVPGNNADSQRADTLVLKWNQVAAASGYECQLSTSLSFSSLVFTKDSTTGTTFVATGLQNLQKYYWRVRALNIGGTTPFSAADSFTTVTAAPPRPHLLSPFQQASVPRKSTFEWDSSASAISYDLQVSADNEFITIVVDTTVADTCIRLTTILEPGAQYYWRVNATNVGGTSAYSAVGGFTTGTGIDAINEASGIPKEFKLFQNYPNPFNPATVIQYDVPKTSEVTIVVYDVTGREVATLVDAKQAAGRYTVQFNGSKFATGMYFFRLVASPIEPMTAGAYVKTLKMMMIK